MKVVNIPKSNKDPYYRYTRQILEIKKTSKNGGEVILMNIDEICKSLYIDPNLLTHFMIKKLGCTMKDNTIRTTFGLIELEELIEEFIGKYIICPVCQNPEGIYKLDSNILTRKCLACGCVNKKTYK